MINVTPRKWMVKMRTKLRLTREQMARACECTAYLLEMLEEHGAITHPNIAARIARRYGMDISQYNDLVHESHAARVVPAYTAKPNDIHFTWSGYAATLEKEVDFV